MEKLKPGRKPLPVHLKKNLVAAYLTKEEKELIIKEFGSLTHAIRMEILSKFMQNGHSNSFGNWKQVAR